MTDLKNKSTGSFWSHVPIDRDWLLFPEKSNKNVFGATSWLLSCSSLMAGRKSKHCFFFAEKKKKTNLFEQTNGPFLTSGQKWVRIIQAEAKAKAEF
jgi:hypothetical protein